MLPKLFVTALLSTLALPTAFAQGLGSLPLCAATCVAEVAKARNCILPTPQCICPGQLDIHNCISRSCQIEDLGPANTIVNSFCSTPASSSSTASSSSPPPLPRPNPSTTSTGPTFAPPITIVTVTTGQSSIPASQSSSSSSSSSTSSTSSTTSSTASALIIPTTTPAPTPLSTSESPQTVVVFSTQFAPPSPFTGNSSASSTPNTALTLLISTIISGIVGISIL